MEHTRARFGWTLRLAFASTIALVALAGCQSLSDGAKETFSQENTCPADRVEVRERPELKASSFTTGTSQPPADIAADPERLKMWQKEQRERLERNDNNGHKYAQARGCGKTVLYDCRGPTNQDRPQRPWFCSEVTKVPDSIAKW